MYCNVLLALTHQSGLGRGSTASCPGLADWISAWRSGHPTEAALYVSRELISYLFSQISFSRPLCSFPHLAEYLDRTASSSALSVDYMPGLSTPALSAGSSSASLSSLPSDRASTFGMSRKGSSSSVGGDDKSKKKKPLESNGVRQLKKASTRGMSPLTSFFQKKTPTPSPNEETPPAV